eukprot:672253-Pyramimonas_sp.AAC.1
MPPVVPVAPPAPPPPPPPPPPVPPPAGGGGGGGLPAHIVVLVPGLGRISYYDTFDRKYFVANCADPDHVCHLPCHTTRVSTPGHKKGQGRPLGWMMSWLERQGGLAAARAATRHDHVHGGWRPTFEERRAARERLALLPGGLALIAEEFVPPGQDPGAEPIEFV